MTKREATRIYKIRLRYMQAQIELRRARAEWRKVAGAARRMVAAL